MDFQNDPMIIVSAPFRVALEYSAHGEEKMVEEAEFAETMETPLLGNKGSTSYLDQLCLQLKIILLQY